MYFKPYIAPFSLLAPALAFPHKRAAESFIVDVTTSPPVESVDDLKLTATVSNNGAETVKILKYGTILDDKLPTKSFVVTKDDEAVKFTGIMLSISLPDADDTAYATIAPGENITVFHDVVSLFDFPSSGAGTFKFEPITNFIVSNSIKTNELIKSDSAAAAGNSAPTFSRLEATPHAVEVTINSPISKRAAAHFEKRAQNVCTDASKKSFIDHSYAEAKVLANVSTSYISNMDAGDSVYQTYFGNTTTSKVSSVLEAVGNENSSSRVLDCSDPLDACSSGIIAYTVTRTTNIYFCDFFFGEVPTSTLCTGNSVASRDVRGRTTLHEACT